MTDEDAVFYWPGSSVGLYFYGSALEAELNDEKGYNYYYAIIDDSVVDKIHTKPGKHFYSIAKGVGEGRHYAQLFRLTEARFGKTKFYGFKVTDGNIVDTTIPNIRNIEYYGNSITCGFAVDDTEKDRGQPEFSNNYYSYAAITARRFHAHYRCIAKSGIGLMVSWFPIIMPEMYNRLDPDDTLIKWDFSHYTPDIVVINLLQNDAFLVHIPQNQQFKTRFGDKPPKDEQIIAAYKDFVQSLRTKYPTTTIICALGSMDAVKIGEPWTSYIDSAVHLLHDPKIMTCFFPYNNTGKHPKRDGQLQMADILTTFIKEKVKW